MEDNKEIITNVGLLKWKEISDINSSIKSEKKFENSEIKFKNGRHSIRYKNK